MVTKCELVDLRVAAGRELKRGGEHQNGTR